MSDEKDGFNDANDCDVVVDISSEVDHINNPQVNEWLKPDDNGFRPTPQQEKFRSLAYRLAQRKRFSVVSGTKPRRQRVSRRCCK